MDYHDVLAAVGAGSAHPGGFGATLSWLQEVPIRAEWSVLEVGCGTGRTLVEIGQRYGCRLTGVDVRAAMLAKAHRRGAQTRVRAKWVKAPAEALPFVASSFDLVYTESVNVFVDVDQAVREYARVLKPGGTYVDVEMMVTSPVAADFHESARNVYGALQVPDLRAWKAIYRRAGLVSITVLGTYAVRPEDRLAMDSAYPDGVALADAGAYQKPSVLRVLRNNAEWLDQYSRSLGYGIFLCQRSHGLTADVGNVTSVGSNAKEDAGYAR